MLFSDKRRLDFLENMANTMWRIELGSTGTRARLVQVGGTGGTGGGTGAGKHLREAIDEAMLACGLRGRPAKKD
jgi:hypothetical protein